MRTYILPAYLITRITNVPKKLFDSWVGRDSNVFSFNGTRFLPNYLFHPNVVLEKSLYINLTNFIPTAKLPSQEKVVAKQTTKLRHIFCKIIKRFFSVFDRST